MIGWLVFIVYAACWLASSVFATRWIADNKPTCHHRDRTEFRSLCNKYHPEGCWKPSGEITIPRFVSAVSASAIWPALIPLAVAWSLANKRPTVGGLQKEIARLEREVGIE